MRKDVKILSMEEKWWYTGVGEDSTESLAVRCHEKAKGSRGRVGWLLL